MGLFDKLKNTAASAVGAVSYTHLDVNKRQMWNDPDIAVDWKLDRVGGIDKVILADKDKNLQTFKEFMSKYGGF